MRNAPRPFRSSPTTRFSQTAASLLDVYPVRFMLSLSASLGLLLVAVHLPWYNTPQSVGWRSAPSLLTLQEVTEVKDKESSGAPITVLGGEEGAAEGEEETQAEEEAVLPVPDLPLPVRVGVRDAVLEFSEVQPQIRGGLGAYYIHIDYPQAARDAGIQGRLVLAFTVEKDGRASDISLLQPLHPLLDSSAVRALRQTRFVPGEQDDEAVRVRMRLPVRFQIVNEAPADTSLASKKPRDSSDAG